MATITVSDLHPAGSNFFKDSESFLNELADPELSSTQGGTSPITPSSWACAAGAGGALIVGYEGVKAAYIDAKNGLVNGWNAYPA